MRYTVTKNFVFRGYQFNPGELFDAEEMQCDTSRARTLMNQRYIVPGYDGENAPLGNKKTKTVSKPAPAPSAPEATDPQDNEGGEGTDTENDPENEPEADSGEEESGEEESGEEESEPEEEPAPTKSKRRS